MKSTIVAGDGVAAQQKAAAAVVARPHVVPRYWNSVAWRLLGRYVLSTGGGAILQPFRSVGHQACSGCGRPRTLLLASISVYQAPDEGRATGLSRWFGEGKKVGRSTICWKTNT
jgi:hypothetical protein